MPEADVREEKNFYLDIPQTSEGFPLKGCNNLDWGLKNRLSQIFSAETSNGHARHRPRLLPGPHNRPRANRRKHTAAAALRGHTHAHPRDLALDHPADIHQGHRLKGIGRPEHLEGTFKRADRH